MKRINLTKYGFTRWPERDFSDDGNRFTCYRAGKNVRVSKCLYNGEVFLSIETCVGNKIIPYAIYSNLPHYREAAWNYNGISVSSLTDEDLKNFYDACVAYEQEYEEAAAKI
jgi:hypothetical protein